uniref:Uncharacterized protein n=1 Tax=Paramoeba aestuarina TaxID=180227 RepID=A0A7S4KI91_9EUKA|mmetsp:Transcript_19623/g.30748  ORF Transcript_19623/g.30748 Transcript_19623/m.30748 type:complete len:215 (+) Transcript_19623:32-676(+)
MTASDPQDSRDIDPSTVTDTLKLLLIGDSGVGKSCLLYRFTNNKFDTSNLSTIGIDFKVRYLMVDDLPVKLELWDTAGQERFRSITNAYYRGADGIAICFDTSNSDSFTNLPLWIDNISRLSDAEKTNSILIGNKIDLQERRLIAKSDAEALARKFNMQYFETSAKSGLGVENAFTTFVTDIVRSKREKARESGISKKSRRPLKKKSSRASDCC